MERAVVITTKGAPFGTFRSLLRESRRRGIEPRIIDSPWRVAEAAGANATAMLRHSKREITESYLDPKIVKRQQPADVLFRLAK
jgi:hypothetical protein